MAIAGIFAIDWWNEDERKTEEINALCDHLGWPHQASQEWLTDDQMNELMGVTYNDLHAAEDAKPLAADPQINQINSDRQRRAGM